jgi:hypothetical protein
MSGKKKQESKKQQENNLSFERKEINGKPNPKYVDLLEEDKPIAGQKFVCVSFISPEKVLKQKDIYFFEQFLKKWEFNKVMEKNVQFLNFLSYKYNIDFESITNDFKDFVKEEGEKIADSGIEDDYKTFLDNNEEDLEKKFLQTHNFQTCVRGVKIRGSYPSMEEAEIRCKMLREADPAHDIFVCPVGLWAPMDPEAYKTGRVEYMEEELNQLMHKKKENESSAKHAFDQRVKESKQKAMEENMLKAEKSGNVLTQTIDENGNLIGITSQNDDIISTADLRKELFEGENIVTGETDHGQSLLVSGPFAKVKDDMDEVD